MRRQAISRILVQHAVCTDAVTAWAANWNSGIEARVRRAFDEGKVAEAFVFAEVVDNKVRQVARIVERQRAVLGSEVYGGKMVVPKANRSSSNSGSPLCSDRVRVASARRKQSFRSKKDMRQRRAFRRRAPNCAKAVRALSSEARGAA